ncbi:AAA domain-containing protein [Salinisphaera sp. Q1T1-3]|uniref:AAA domain-containing protein n=1 Tax=Salinisphaera sp. Q1T1-3 TaxID=2321229 RepID=UPI001314F78D|nr:AAA domain-containing protein [Salinisphaera sp. Q1T1-3]
MSHDETMTSTTRAWLRYWRHSLADSQSGRGALSESALRGTASLAASFYRDGRLPSDHPALAALFADEPATTRLVRVVLRPAVFKVLQAHGQKKQALYPDVVTPLLCGLWVARDGRFIPAEPPVIPRDLLQPQADDRFTLAHVADQDRVLSRAEPAVWSASEALALLDDDAGDVPWKAYYDLSRSLFNDLCPRAFLDTAFVSADEARLAKVDDQLGAAHHIIKLYDWLSVADQPLPLVEGYAQRHVESHRPCVAAGTGAMDRLGHANTRYPLAIAQRDALAQSMALGEGELLAVNGPPGTGKTTFVLSVVASQWVKAALDQTEPPLIVAASSNNQAVTNILEAFADGFEETDDPFGGRWLPGIDSYGGYYPARSREDDAARHYQTPAFYRRLESPVYLDTAEAAFLGHARRAFEDDTLDDVDTVRERLHQELERTRGRLQALQRRWADRAARHAELVERLGDAPEQRLAQAQQRRDGLQAEAEAHLADLQQWQRLCAEEPVWLSLFAFVPPVARKRRARRALFIATSLSADARQRIEAAPAGSDPESVLREALADRRQAVAQADAFLETGRACLQALDTAHAALDNAYRKLGFAAVPDSFDVFDQTLDTSLRFTLFQRAVHYWEARWLADCAARAEELTEQTARGREKPGRKKVRPRWRRRMMLTPCIVSTLHSLPSHMTHRVFEGQDRYREDYLTNEIDLLIVDEAGQVAPDVAGASTALARRLLAIGDIHQIKPVATQSPSIDVGNLAHQGLLANRDAYDTLREGGRTVVDGSVMRIAQAASRVRYLDDAEAGMFLRAHRRCLDAIIAYCNALCYRGLLQPLRDTPAIDPALPPLGYVHVDGCAETPASGSRVNRLEAITIAEWLADQRTRLEKTHGKPLAQIVGVVTPFKAQARLIAQACRARDISVGTQAGDMTIGTVHALQGAERDVVLFSGVYSRHTNGRFIDDDPAMLNVAVSRARDSFLVFGDMDVIGSAARGSPRHLLGRYLFSEPNNALPFAASAARPDLLALCETPRLINDAEAHDRCIRELLEGARRWVALVSPWISLDRLEETGLADALRQAADRHVAITIYTDHHFNTTQATQPDADRTARFEKCCAALTAMGLTVNVVTQVHSKLIMADDRFLCVGSYNWASAAREGRFKNMETSMLYSGNLTEETRIQLDALNARIRG